MRLSLKDGNVQVLVSNVKMIPQLRFFVVAETLKGALHHPLNLTRRTSVAGTVFSYLLPVISTILKGGLLWNEFTLSASPKFTNTMPYHLLGSTHFTLNNLHIYRINCHKSSPYFDTNAADNNKQTTLYIYGNNVKNDLCIQY